MSDYITIWNGFFGIVVEFWNFVFSYQNGIVGALIIIMMMIIVIKLIFFGAGSGNDK